jgi:hypothetical protein
MKKRIYHFALVLFLIGAAFKPLSVIAQPVPAPVCLCDNVAWGPIMTHQFYFTPMSMPGCVMYAEIRYRTKNCNGMLMYEIVDEEFSVISGTCGFATCAQAVLFKDVEKEMILNVLGTTNVYSSKPSACYRLVELDPLADPGFNYCWTDGGASNPTGKPMTYINCSNYCCVAQAKIYYDAGGRAWVHWTPISDVTCDESIPVPAQVSFTACCETITVASQPICNDERVFTLNVTQSGPCYAYCDGSMMWKQSSVTTVEETNKMINANIRFFQNAKAVPNPNNGQFDVTIVLPNNQSVAVELMDLNGKLVKNYTINYDVSKTQYPIDAQELKSGVYLCRINTTAFGDKVIKVVKK